MGDVFKPKAAAAETQPSELELAAQQNADQEQLDAIRKQSEARTAQIMRLFGGRGSFGFGGGF